MGEDKPTGNRRRCALSYQLPKEKSDNLYGELHGRKCIRIPNFKRRNCSLSAKNRICWSGKIPATNHSACAHGGFIAGWTNHAYFRFRCRSRLSLSRTSEWPLGRRFKLHPIPGGYRAEAFCILGGWKICLRGRRVERHGRCVCCSREQLDACSARNDWFLQRRRPEGKCRHSHFS